MVQLLPFIGAGILSIPLAYNIRCIVRVIREWWTQGLEIIDALGALLLYGAFLAVYLLASGYVLWNIWQETWH